MMAKPVHFEVPTKKYSALYESKTKVGLAFKKCMSIDSGYLHM